MKTQSNVCFDYKAENWLVSLMPSSEMMKEIEKSSENLWVLLKYRNK